MASPAPHPDPVALLPFGVIAAGDELLSRFLLPECRADPYPFYDWLREHEPVYRTGRGQVVLSRHDDVVTALRHPEFGRPPMPDLPVDALRVLMQMFLLQDPPDHTRQRTVVSRYFTPRAMEAWRARVAEIVDELLDAADGDALDLIADVAHPLPVQVISELLGVPAADRPRFAGWSRALVGLLDPSFMEPAGLLDALQAADDFVAYAGDLIADRREQRSREDLLGALVDALDAGRLSHDEAVSICVLLLIAGHETTVNLIGNGMVALLRHPAELRRLHADPALVPTAVEELLRYEPPVPIVTRMAHNDVDVGGTSVLAGELAILLLAAANRDPAAFDDPTRLDVTRSPNPHVSFGHGIHFCLGAPLARLEGQVAIAAIIDRFPSIELRTATPQWRESLALRGLVSLPVAAR